jgi:hypothetical protein
MVFHMRQKMWSGRCDTERPLQEQIIAAISFMGDTACGRPNNSLIGVLDSEGCYNGGNSNLADVVC